MEKLKLGIFVMAAMLIVTLLLSGRFAFAAERAPMTQELAAKSETVRKQRQQRVTPEKRKAAAAALKAERLKIHQARQAVQQSAPAVNDKN